MHNEASKFAFEDEEQGQGMSNLSSFIRSGHPEEPSSHTATYAGISVEQPVQAVDEDRPRSAEWNISEISQQTSILERIDKRLLEFIEEQRVANQRQEEINRRQEEINTKLTSMMERLFNQ